MSDEQRAIEVRDLSKSYRIYESPEGRLKQAIVPRIGRALGSWGSNLQTRRYFRDFWALRDVSFDVCRGEAFGIIGRNGAGKSTLLQIIAGTLQPTTGSAQVKGRVAALLELGSGFNPEFTGRENVYINAALFGLKSCAIDERFEDIAAFADIGDFIEQPVKTYSSGMMMRLAFAVQVAFDPDVIIVDEALAVGDMFFQAKCMHRLRKLIDNGVAVLFVTHDIGTIRQFCERAILLEHGRPMMQGTALAVSDQYSKMQLSERNQATQSDLPTTAPVRGSQAGSSADEQRVANPEWMTGSEAFAKRAVVGRTGNRAAEFLNVQLLSNGSMTRIVNYEEEVVLRQLVRFNHSLANVNVVYKLRTLQGVDLVFMDSRIANETARRFEAGCTYAFEWSFRANLMHGKYVVLSAMAQPPGDGRSDWLFLDVVPICYEFDVLPRSAGMIDGFVTWPTTLVIKVGHYQSLK